MRRTEAVAALKAGLQKALGRKLTKAEAAILRTVGDGPTPAELVRLATEVMAQATGVRPELLGSES